MEKTEFVTKDNVHEATNLEKIRSLMANAERLGDDEVVKRCNARLLELSNTIIKFPEIDYNYWKNKHPFYHKIKLKKNDSVSKGLIHAQQGGLIKKQDYQFAKSLVDTIENKINQIDLNECGYEELLTIFDLIQGWGGQQCRPTYYPKKKKLPKGLADPEGLTKGSFEIIKPKRLADPRQFADDYLKIIKLLIDVSGQEYLTEDTVKELEKSLRNLDNVGMPFGSKHFFFWSRFKKQRNILYIYDTRMVAITKILNGKKMSYYSYLMFLSNIEQSLKLDAGVAEQGLFSFSHNFFSNDDPPIFVNLNDTKKDIQVAKTFVKNI
ncbi:hypothetical protein N9E40_04600 [Amylibacter sp.]|nr:hypothetical protein [Amylibacter sp.]MDB0015560.1 hypothetical protein [Amylibacter sp.]